MIQNETFKAEKSEKFHYWDLLHVDGEKIGYISCGYLDLFDLIPISDTLALHDICTKIQKYEAGM